MWYLIWILGLSLAVLLVTMNAVKCEDDESARDATGNNRPEP
jgi:cyd operon protein YbgT